MNQKAGAQISRKAFIQTFLILLTIMLAAGILTLVIPAGSYTRVSQDGNQTIVPGTFQYTAKPDYPIWRWLIAPFEVLGGPDGLTIIIIMVFILMVGVSLGLLDQSGVIRAAIARIVRRYEKRKYVLLLVISFFFMLLGSVFGLFEEVVPTIPIMVALSYLLGWDVLVGLGMSILATNMGFSAAMTNPFTIGLAQKIAGLPEFSGILFRIPIFLVVYAAFAWFLVSYARKIERNPQKSLVYGEDAKDRARYQNLKLDELLQTGRHMERGMAWFVGSFLLILVVFIVSPFVPAISRFALPLVGLLFLVAGVGASLISGLPGREVWKAAIDGALGIAPGLPLIMISASVKYIVAMGGIMDTILYHASNIFSPLGPFPSILFIYILALVLELFVASASGKIFLMMPILFPLGRLVGLEPQAIVTAYCFGDGFTNMIYPTNAVLLISLGLASVSYSKWFRWTFKLWMLMLPITVAFLGLAIAIGYK